MPANEKIQAIAHDLLTAFQSGTLPAALAQVFIRRDIDVPSKHWTWTNRTVGILRGHVYAAGFRQWGQSPDAFFSIGHVEVLARRE